MLGGTSTPQRNHDAERDFLFSSAKSSFTTWREVPCLRPGASPVHQVAQLVQKHMLQVFNYASYHQPSWYYLKVYVWRPWFWFWLHCCLVTEFLWCCWDLGSCFAFVMFPVCVYCVCSCLHVYDLSFGHFLLLFWIFLPFCLKAFVIFPNYTSFSPLSSFPYVLFLQMPPEDMRKEIQA